jgi:TolB-like protein/Tfp pilus assembly protein PilF
MAKQQASFLEELKRRNVIRVGLAYALIAWLLAQVADLALESFEAPGWAMKTVLLLLALGFPLALFLAWAFELTPEGIKPEADVDRSGATPRAGSRRLDFAIIAMLSVTLVYFLVTHDWGDADATRAGGPKSIAVLPFDNMSDSKENAFFASGVHEDILTYLSKVGDLRVISRTSVRKYADAGVGISAIAAELGVDHIVEGSVRRAGNTVRVTAQLIDARTEQHLWAESYDRDLSNVFDIQTAIAQEIVAALQTELSEDEQRAISTVPTRNIDAYDKYSQARAIRRGNTYSRAQVAEMEPLLLQAVELDPRFAVARALLGSVHTNFYWLDMDRTEERLQRARAEIDTAFELQPGLPEARAALAEYYYRGFNNYARALTELQAAHEKFPNNTEILELMGVTQRRLGQWDAAIGHLRAATQLDPGDLSKKYTLLETMVKAHKWDMGSAYGEELMAAYPDEPMIRAQRAYVHLFGDGDVAAADALLVDIGPVMDPDYLYLKLSLTLIAGDYGEALALVDDYRPLLEAFSPGAADFLRSWVHAFKGDDAAARAYAAKVVDAVDLRADESPAGATILRLLAAEAYARLGQSQAAIRLCREVLELNPLTGDALEMPGNRAGAARIMAMAGDVDTGLDILAEVLDKPAGPTRWELRLHPSWRFLDDDPRFRALAGL